MDKYLPLLFWSLFISTFVCESDLILVFFLMNIFVALQVPRGVCWAHDCCVPGVSVGPGLGLPSQAVAGTVKTSKRCRFLWLAYKSEVSAVKTEQQLSWGQAATRLRAGSNHTEATILRLGSNHTEVRQQPYSGQAATILRSGSNNTEVR